MTPVDSETIIVAVVADTHVNSVAGLLPGPVTTDQKGTYRPNMAQRVTLAAWKDFWWEDGAGIFPLAAELGAKVWAVFNGDLNDYNIHDRADMISGAKSDIIRWTVDLVKPIVDEADYSFIVRGTEAHVGKRAHLEEEVGADLETIQDPETDRYTWYWLKLDAAGVRFDIAHHPCTSSRRAHTRDAAAERQAAETVLQYNRRREPIPHIVIRSHAHYAGQGGQMALGMFTPPWKITPDVYGQRLGGAGAIEPVGGLYFICRGGEYESKVRRWWPKRQRLWKPS